MQCPAWGWLLEQGPPIINLQYISFTKPERTVALSCMGLLIRAGPPIIKFTVHLIHNTWGMLYCLAKGLPIRAGAIYYKVYSTLDSQYLRGMLHCLAKGLLIRAGATYHKVYSTSDSQYLRGILHCLAKGLFIKAGAIYYKVYSTSDSPYLRGVWHCPAWGWTAPVRYPPRRSWPRSLCSRARETRASEGSSHPLVAVRCLCHH